MSLLPVIPPPPALVAQGFSGNNQALAAALWAMALIVAVVIGGVIVVSLRRRLFAPDNSMSAMPGGMMLDELRDLKRRGELTEEEYQEARDALTARLTGRPASSPPRRPSTSGRGVSDGALVAPPGFDLTGQPLPQFGPPPSSSSPPPPRAGNPPDRGGAGPTAGGSGGR